MTDIKDVLREQVNKVMTDIKDTLQQRGSQYGDFTTHAQITQELKAVLNQHREQLSDMHIEALEMIFHKIGRILNGNPNYVDSWHDIAGYATLVVERLPKDAK